MKGVAGILLTDDWSAVRTEPREQPMTVKGYWYHDQEKEDRNNSFPEHSVKFQIPDFRWVEFRKLNIRTVDFRKLNIRWVDVRKLNIRTIDFRKLFNFRIIELLAKFLKLAKVIDKIIHTNQMYEKEKKEYLYTSRIHKSRQREKILRLCEYTDPVYEEKFFGIFWRPYLQVKT